MPMTSRGLNTGSFGTSTYLDELCADELRLDLRLAVFQQHLQDFAEVCVQLTAIRPGYAHLENPG